MGFPTSEYLGILATRNPHYVFIINTINSDYSVANRLWFSLTPLKSALSFTSLTTLILINLELGAGFRLLFLGLASLVVPALLLVVFLLALGRRLGHELLERHVLALLVGVALGL